MKCEVRDIDSIFHRSTPKNELSNKVISCSLVFSEWTTTHVSPNHLSGRIFLSMIVMSNYSSEPSCPYCGSSLNQQEIDFLQHGTSVRCQRCGSFLTIDQVQSTRVDLVDSYQTPVRTAPSYEPAKKKGAGVFIFFIGLVVFSLGLFSWVFYIPIFSDGYYGELFGIILLVKGISDLRKEARNPSGIWIMLAGLFLWIMAWVSWLTYIPILSDGFIGEFGGLGLIIFGYLKSR